MIRAWIKFAGTFSYLWSCDKCGRTNIDEFGEVQPKKLPTTTLPCQKCGARIKLTK
jgi:DNA-directed RNA polymerase subunit RPC12/RpoP